MNRKHLLLVLFLGIFFLLLFVFIANSNQENKTKNTTILKSRSIEKDFFNEFITSEGNLVEMSQGTNITFNLFPNLTYTGIVDRTEKNSLQSYSWIGKIKNVDYSSFYVVYSDGVFIAHFASPQGIYEISRKEGNKYEVIKIEQPNLPD